MTSVRHASGCLWTLVLISYWKMPIIDSFDVHYSKICCLFVLAVFWSMLFVVQQHREIFKYFRNISWNISWNISGQKNSWNFTSLAVSMSIWVCTRPHYFYCPSPDFTTSIVSQSVTNNRCAPHVGGTREKWGAHPKIFGRRAPHLQIASDATAHQWLLTRWAQSITVTRLFI